VAPGARREREVRQFAELKRQYAMLKEEHELLKKAIRFCSARKARSLPSSRRRRTDVGESAVQPAWRHSVWFLLLAASLPFSS